MKYSIPLFALALTAVAEPTRSLNKKATLVERDLAAVTSILANIKDLTGKLDTAITGFSGDFDSVKSASDAVLSAISEGTSMVQSGSQMTLQDALGIQAPVTDLTSAVQTAVDDTISKKADFVAAGKGGDVLASLQAQKAGSADLSGAISAKLPQEVQSLAATLSAGITDALQKGIDEYQDQAGASSGGSSSPSSSASAPSSAPSASTGSSSSGSSSSGSSSSGSSSSGSVGSSSGAVASTPASPVASKSATTSSPAQFTGAASINSFSGLGALAAVAAVLAF